MPHPPIPAAHLTPEDVADDLGISLNTMYQRIKRDQRARTEHLVPPFVRVARRYVIHRDDYAAWKRGLPVRQAAERAAALLLEAERHRAQAAVLEREAHALTSA